MDSKAQQPEAIFDRVQVVPAGGALLFYVSPHTLDSELMRIRQELHEFFGESRKVGVVRSGDLEVIYFADAPSVSPLGVSPEGVSWAMDQCTCRVIDGQHDPHCPGSPGYWREAVRV